MTSPPTVTSTLLSDHDPALPLNVVNLDLDGHSQIRPLDNQGSYITGFRHGHPIGSLVMSLPANGLCTCQLLLEFQRQYPVQEARARLLYKACPTPWVKSSYSVAVCTSDRPDSLERCLSSLDHLDRRCAEVLVIDNGSIAIANQIRELSATYGFRYIREPLGGLDRARNRALFESRSDLLIFTDDDVEIEAGWDRWLIDGFQDDLVMVTAGLVLPSALQSRHQILCEQLSSHSRGTTRVTYNNSHRFPPYAPDGNASSPGVGASMAVRRQFALSLGGFPEHLGAGTPTGGGEDTWLMRATLQRGFRLIYEPRSVAKHRHRDSEEELRRLLRNNATGVWALAWNSLLTERSCGKALNEAAGAFNWTARTAIDLARDAKNAQVRSLATPGLFGALVSPARYLQSVRKTDTGPLITDRPPTPAVWRKPVAQQSDDLVTMPSLSVCIPTRGRCNWVQELAAALLKVDTISEVVIAIDGDIDGTEDALGRLRASVNESDQARLRWTRLHPPGGNPEAGHGPGRARNAAADLAKSDYLLFLDDDVELVSWNFAAAHLRAHLDVTNEGTDDQRADGSDDLIVVGGAFVDLRDATTVKQQAARNWWVDNTQRLRTEDENSFIDLCSSNISLSASLFGSLGGFPEIDRREDWLLGLLAQSKNIKISGHVTAAVMQRDASRVQGRFDRHREGAGDATVGTQFPDYLRTVLTGQWRDLPLYSNLARLSATYPNMYALVDGILFAAEKWITRPRLLARRLQGLRNFLGYWAGVGQVSSFNDILRLLDDGSTAHYRSVPTIDLASSDTPSEVSNGMPFAVVYDGHHLGYCTAVLQDRAFGRRQLRYDLIDRYAAEIASLVSSHKSCQSAS